MNHTCTNQPCLSLLSLTSPVAGLQRLLGELRLVHLCVFLNAGAKPSDYDSHHKHTHRCDKYAECRDHPASSCELYPIAVSLESLEDVEIGDRIILLT